MCRSGSEAESDWSGAPDGRPVEGCRRAARRESASVRRQMTSLESKAEPPQIDLIEPAAGESTWSAVNSSGTEPASYFVFAR